MPITFKFELDKAIQVMVYIASRLQKIEKVKLVKLLYIADRTHFLSHGYPITGDRQYAMRWGPLPSRWLDAINGQAWPNPDAAFEFLHVNDNWVTVRQSPGENRLSVEEKQTLDVVISEYGDKNPWAIVGETHRYPEYKEAYTEGTSIPILYEAILKHSGKPEHYRHGRPVVSQAMISHMICPFHAGPETDL